MKILKRIAIVLLLLPVILIALFLFWEMFGMRANHIATDRQTNKLQENLEHAIEDVQILEIYSETGNTSGTGNHVDCLSEIEFSTKMSKEEVEEAMAEYYRLDGWSSYIESTDDGHLLIVLNTPAPFPNNIEGH